MMRRAIAAALAVMIGAAGSEFFYAGLVPPFRHDASQQRAADKPRE